MSRIEGPPNQINVAVDPGELDDGLTVHYQKLMRKARNAEKNGDHEEGSLWRARAHNLVLILTAIAMASLLA